MSLLHLYSANISFCRYREGSVEYLGRGESYRPGGSRRSPPPRVPPSDSYIPSSRAGRPRSRSPDSYRRRSRSPRRDGGSWRERARSPPRRAYSPPRADTYRRDARDRSPRRERYDDRERYPRSPPRRERTPLRRSRDASPAGSRGLRSPPRSRYDEPKSRGTS